MIVVDSSGWLEFLTDGPLANDFARRLRQPNSVLMPALVRRKECRRFPELSELVE